MIKFGFFNDKWGKDFDRIATGHYATTEVIDGTTFLATAKDPVKDQTDFLAQLSYPQISKVMFPIGHMMKSEVRQIAHRAGLPSADRKDSQGICFLGKINYNDFLRRYLGEKEGKIVELETGKILGTHKGYWFHTIGQRKGLLLSGGPWFVVKKDIEDNVLYVSQGYDPATQYGNVINMEGFHYLSKDIWGDFESVDVKFKIRHTPDFAQGHLTKVGDIYRITSDTRIQGIAPGQYGIVYDNDARLVVASGMIV
jgi:tRNA (5-methylaminomethyl-2-thiouridylate)-methyltransferase